MKDVKLTDFSLRELQTLLDALAIHEATLKMKKRNSPEYDDKELERVHLLVTQVINAKVQVRMNERVNLN